MKFLLSPDATSLLVAVIVVVTIPIVIGVYWLILRVSDLRDRLGWIDDWPRLATPAIAENLLEVARTVRFDDEINSLDLNSAKQGLERELQSRFGDQKLALMPSASSKPVTLPDTVVQFFKEWGVLEGIGSDNFCFGPSYIEDCRNGVVHIGSSDASFAVIVMPSDVVFERENDSQLDWDVTPVAKTIYHFALKLCRDSYDENDGE